MILKASIKDLVQLSSLYKSMYKELFGSDAVDYDKPYVDTVVKDLSDTNTTIYVDSEYRGFFTVVDISEPTVKTKRAQGTRVYILPEYRNSKLLHNFYSRLFKDYKDYDIYGNTEIISPHIKVMDKRHTLVSKVYKLIRR